MSQNPIDYKLSNAQNELLELSEILSDDVTFIASLIHFFSNEPKSAISKRLENLRPNNQDLKTISFVLDNAKINTLLEMQMLKD